MAVAKLDINSVLKALDTKDRDFYDRLSDDEKKAFSPFMMIRWAASVTGNNDMQSYYLQAVNKRLNKNFFALPKQHVKLQWLITTTISPGLGKQSYRWLGLKKKDADSNNKVKKFLQQTYPDMKESDIELLGKLNTLSDWKELAKDMGMMPDQIKKLLG